jgi:hypothetical protein
MQLLAIWLVFVSEASSGVKQVEDGCVLEVAALTVQS